ncbi:hypothetical protein [Paenibacillus pedocola]|uniref:hypothetical protein n=1 Tax=Paenibacillus pedocola TaxID=3242193 RepID=UPI0028775825|nr:hypothetical protein [Paenibacillus typhae]
MLKLIRYDFRRSRDRILAAFVIMILIHTGIWVSSGTTSNDILSGHLLTYFSIGAAFLFITVINYNRNLKSYARRLLPVNTLYTVLSPLLQFWMLLLTLMLIGLIHLGLYILFYSADFLPGNFWSVALRSALQCTWTAGLVLLMTIFACTVARSLKVRGKIWIGIAVLAGLQNGVAYLEQLLFKSYFLGIGNAFQFEVLKASDVPSGLKLNYVGSNVWPVIFEVAIAGLLIYATTVLVKRRTDL